MASKRKSTPTKIKQHPILSLNCNEKIEVKDEVLVDPTDQRFEDLESSALNSKLWEKIKENKFQTTSRSHFVISIILNEF